LALYVSYWWCFLICYPTPFMFMLQVSTGALNSEVYMCTVLCMQSQVPALQSPSTCVEYSVASFMMGMLSLCYQLYICQRPWSYKQILLFFIISGPYSLQVRTYPCIYIFFITSLTSGWNQI
jgi:hypothetical protein